jgi:hypothetical protein
VNPIRDSASAAFQALIGLQCPNFPVSFLASENAGHFSRVTFIDLGYFRGAALSTEETYFPIELLALDKAPVSFSPTIILYNPSFGHLSD